jgi:hypothetical protein
VGNFEDEPDSRWSLSRFLKVGLIIAGVGYLPIQLYILLGPPDGNPIGLGLLFVIGVFVGLAVLAIGLIKHAIELFRDR